MSLFSLLSQSVTINSPVVIIVVNVDVLWLASDGTSFWLSVSGWKNFGFELVAKLLLKAVGASCLDCPLVLCHFPLHLEIRTLNLETALCLSWGMWSNLSGQLLVDVGEQGVFLHFQQPNDMTPLCSWLGAVLGGVLGGGGQLCFSFTGVNSWYRMLIMWVTSLAFVMVFWSEQGEQDKCF